VEVFDPALTPLSSIGNCIVRMYIMIAGTGSMLSRVIYWGREIFLPVIRIIQTFSSGQSTVQSHIGHDIEARITHPFNHSPTLSIARPYNNDVIFSGLVIGSLCMSDFMKGRYCLHLAVCLIS
jgi:hypothetical protein